MYEITFLDSLGRCNAPIRVDDGSTALEVLMRYKEIVPVVFASLNGALAFESRDGQILWPDDLTPEDLRRVEQRFPCSPGHRSALELLFEYQEAFLEVRSDEAGEWTVARLALQAIEIPLLALAARDGIELQLYGYIASGFARQGRAAAAVK